MLHPWNEVVFNEPRDPEHPMIGARTDDFFPEGRAYGDALLFRACRRVLLVRTTPLFMVLASELELWSAVHATSETVGEWRRKTRRRAGRVVAIVLAAPAWVGATEHALACPKHFRSRPCLPFLVDRRQIQQPLTIVLVAAAVVDDNAEQGGGNTVPSH